MTEEPRPTPVPLPVTPPGPAGGGSSPGSTWRTRLLIALVAVIVIAVLAGCAVLGARFAIDTLIRAEEAASKTSPSAEEYVPEEPATGKGSPAQSVALPKVAWFGNDRYLAIQTSRNVVDGTRNVSIPQVIVWDRTTGTDEIVGDYVLVGAEKAYPRIYLHSEPTEDDVYGDPYADSGERPPLDQYDDMFDDPPWEFFVWAPGKTPETIEETRISWSPWKGPGNSSVEAVINADDGAAPIDLYFSTGGERTQADTYGFFSCEPVGWSPSGKYFAVVTLQDAFADFYEQYDALANATMLRSMQNRVLVYSAADGEVVYDVPLGTARATSVSSAVMWDSSTDMLYHQVVDSPSGAPFTNVVSANLVAVDVKGAKAATRTVDVPASWLPGTWSFLGTQRDSARVVDPSGSTYAVWRLSRGTLAEDGTLEAPSEVVSMAAARDGALARLYRAGSGAEAPLRCDLSESILGPARTIWQEDE